MATLKQRKAFKKALENGGVVSRAMLEADYSPAMAKNPQKLTTTKGWQELLEEYLPDEDLLQVAKQGLNAKRFMYSPEGELIQVDDFATRHKYLETGLKAKQRLTTETGGNKTLIINVSGETAQRYGLIAPQRTETDSA